jgi:hypothetical protein
MALSVFQYHVPAHAKPFNFELFNDFVINLRGDHKWYQGLSSRYYITYHGYVFEIAVDTMMDRLIGH